MVPPQTNIINTYVRDYVEDNVFRRFITIEIRKDYLIHRQYAKRSKLLFAYQLKLECKGEQNLKKDFNILYDHMERYKNNKIDDRQHKYH